MEHVEGETCQTIVIDLKLGKVVTTNGSIENLSADDIVGAADDATKDAIVNSMNTEISAVGKQRTQSRTQISREQKQAVRLL